MYDNIIVVSDLHLGAPSSLLELDQVQERFITKIKSFGKITQFVLLGDIFDLTMAHGADAWNKASAFFYKLFSDLSSDPQIYYIPGNHDHHVWTLLLEQEGIIEPLQKVISSKKLSNLILDPLKIFKDEFSPDTNNFVQALFPEKVRGRVWVKYPFFRTSVGEGKKLLFLHHGHYFDWKITPLTSKVAKKYKASKPEETIAKIEECNYTWIEGMFYFTSLGRTSREFLTRAHRCYDKVLNFHSKFFERLGIDLTSVLGRKIGTLSVRRIKKLMKHIYDESSYILVFGHTHKCDKHPSVPKTINMYNTGGWLVENKNGSPEVKPIILQIEDDQCNPIEFGTEDSEVQEALQRAKNVSPFR